LPRSFLQTTVEEHLEIWRDAPDRLLSQSRHAALVVSLHGCALSELRAQAAPEHAEALQAHIAAERARQARLCATLGVSDSAVQQTRRQMWTWDGLSLALCNNWRPFTANDVPSRDGLTDIELRDRQDGTSTLDPWPFAGDRVEVCCEARRLDARYEEQSTMWRALEQARPLALRFILVAS
jgi:hypothetical protein